MNVISPAPVPSSEQIDFVSANNGRSYRLKIRWPKSEPPESGHPALYVLDGDWYFGLACSGAQTFGGGWSLTSEAIVVSVGFQEPDSDDPAKRRQLELTPSKAAQIDLEAGEFFRNGEFGALESFIDVLEGEVKPIVSKRHRIDDTRSAIFGHSLGGLATLWMLFTRPSMYRTFISIDPSIWWGDRILLREEALFAERAATLGRIPRLFLGIAGDHMLPDAPIPEEWAITRERLRERHEHCRMEANAQELATRLELTPGPSRIEVSTMTFAGETHGSLPYAVFGPAFRFAFPVK
jgi:predicted alpha/beta superfamily hydrolase